MRAAEVTVRAALLEQSAAFLVLSPKAHEFFPRRAGFFLELVVGEDEGEHCEEGRRKASSPEIGPRRCRETANVQASRGADRGRAVQYYSVS